jgi:hypothetical protein
MTWFEDIYRDGSIVRTRMSGAKFFTPMSGAKFTPMSGAKFTPQFSRVAIRRPALSLVVPALSTNAELFDFFPLPIVEPNQRIAFANVGALYDMDAGVFITLSNANVEGAAGTLIAIASSALGTPNLGGKVRLGFLLPELHSEDLLTEFPWFLSVGGLFQNATAGPLNVRISAIALMQLINRDIE